MSEPVIDERLLALAELQRAEVRAIRHALAEAQHLICHLKAPKSSPGLMVQRQIVLGKITEILAMRSSTSAPVDLANPRQAERLRKKVEVFANDLARRVERGEDLATVVAAIDSEGLGEAVFAAIGRRWVEQVKLAAAQLDEAGSQVH